MPMDPKYEELELDAVEARGAGRVWQEMAKNPALPGGNTMPAHPEGQHPNLIAHKRRKTKARIEAESTQVLRETQG